MNVPVSGKLLYPEDRQAMIDLLNSEDDPTFGVYNVLLEKEFAKHIDRKKAFFVNSGSSACLAAFSTFTSHNMYPEWKVLPGDEIITTACSFPTTIAPIVQHGAIPVFLDVDDTYNIKCEDLEKALSPKTKGVSIAHTLGNPFNIERVLDFCKKHGLWLIEDAADAADSLYHINYEKMHKCGYFGHMSTFSMYPAHHWTSLQGGMVVVDDPLLSKIVQAKIQWSRHCTCNPGQDNKCGHRFEGQYGELPPNYDHKYVYSEFGYNLQNTNIHACLGYQQLKHLPAFTINRIVNYTRVFNNLESLFAKNIISTAKVLDGYVPSWFGFPIMLEKHNRKDILQKLNAIGIQTRLLFAGNITRQPMFVDSKVPYRVIGDLAMTDKIMNNMFWTGIWHGLSTEQIDYEIQCLQEVLS